jgi:aspartate aminotransferase
MRGRKLQDGMRALSKKVQDISISQTLAFTMKARSLKDAGIDVISLTAGEPDFPTPPLAKEAAVNAIAADFTHYTPNQGIRELTLAICRKFETDNGLHFSPNQILVSSGAKHSTFNALQALCDAGDEVLIFSPYWTSYPEMVRLVDGVPVIVPTSMANGFRPDVGQLEQAVTNRSKAIILNSPSNPTGVVYTGKELEGIAEVARKHGLYIISDEIYEKVLFDSSKHLSIGAIKGVRDQVITVNGMSKAYAMTGWRIGYMGGPLEVIDAAAKVQSQVTGNANSVAQKAALAALSAHIPEVESMRREFERRRDAGVALLSSINGVDVLRPQGAMYFFFGVRNFLGGKLRTSTDLALFLLEHYHIGVVPGDAFGEDGCLRISFACSMDELTSGLERIKEGLEEISRERTDANV